MRISGVALTIAVISVSVGVLATRSVNGHTASLTVPDSNLPFGDGRLLSQNELDARNAAIPGCEP